jgi:hypothetical protein
VITGSGSLGKERRPEARGPERPPHPGDPHGPAVPVEKSLRRKIGFAFLPEGGAAGRRLGRFP